MTLPLASDLAWVEVPDAAARSTYYLNTDTLETRREPPLHFVSLSALQRRRERQTQRAFRGADRRAGIAARHRQEAESLDAEHEAEASALFERAANERVELVSAQRERRSDHYHRERDARRTEAARVR